MHFAKQRQNLFLMTILLNKIKAGIEDFIDTHKIKALGFVPPTIKREVQLMQFLKTGIDIAIPLINIQKISGKIPIPQKSLSNLAERINNADTTFTIPEMHRYHKILLFDDAVGSGVTLNQIAKKIKEKGVTKYIIGLAIVGSFIGFDVIADV